MRRWRAASVVAALLVATLYSVRAPLLEAAGHFLIREDPPQAADAIVVLSGSFPDRILEAVDLYSEGHARHVVLCRDPENQALEALRRRGVEVRPGYERNRYVAESLGVPAEAIHVVGRSAGSTFDEAQQVLRYVRRQGFDSILLVTSKIHTRRAGAIYRHLAGDAIRIFVRPAREDPFRPASWWGSRTAIRRVVIEYQKLLVFFFVDRWWVGPIDADGDRS
jgi:uncharacterized SAM-binding protein YcdF (DUF218 family)